MMVVGSPQSKPPQAPELEALDGGVIKEARRRQRRERMLVACVAALLAGAAAEIAASGLGGESRYAPPQRSSPPTSPTGPPLSRPTHLRLVVSQNTGPPWIVDVDSGRTQAVHGLGVPREQGVWSPALYPLIAAPGGALAVVTRQDCAHCTRTQADFLIGADGSVRRTTRLTLAGGQQTSTPALGSASASWVLTWPHSNHCTLRLEPRSRLAAAVPCGDLGSGTAAGVVISRSSEVALVDPGTGRVRERFAVHGQFDVLNSNVALTSTAPGIPNEGDAFPTHLTLVNLSTGARTPLRWPSILHFGYRVFPEPNGPLVAVEFADPAYLYTGRQASDLWLLDPRTGAFTHVPGFPILEHLKFSDIAWTSDHRLVVVAQGDRRTAIGIWRPGSTQLQVGTAPQLAGYSQFVPLSR
jgi:hypothetical protein